MYISTFYVLKCFAYVLLFDFCDFQILVNELVTGKVRFPPAPLSDFLEKKRLYFTQGLGDVLVLGIVVCLVIGNS